MEINLGQIREALEGAWDENTSYQKTLKKGSPSFGQCYPTSRIIQFLFPEVEIVEGAVCINNGTEKHFWNLLVVDGVEHHIDFTWQQFPEGSMVKSWKVRTRDSLGDSQETVDRVNLLFQRFKGFISYQNPQVEAAINKRLANSILLSTECRSGLKIAEKALNLNPS